MKTQIIKIIPCLLAGFILSACVGAVTIPSSETEKTDKTEAQKMVEPEPIVLDPATILINRCIMDDNASDASCASAVKENSCITDPFGAACDLTFTNFYETAQANRITFCSLVDNVSDDFCESAIAEHSCIEDPFATGCDTETKFTNYYQTSFDNRLAYCRDNDDSNLCTNAIKTICITTGKPFDTLCSDSHRTENISFCGIRSNRNDPACVAALSRPNVASWLQSFGYTLPTEEIGRSGSARFVQGLKTSFLNLSTATYAGEPLGGDSADGIALFQNVVNFVAYSRAGIISSTDLGAPRTETSGTVTWNGQFLILYGHSHDFILTINFGAGSQAGTIEASVNDYSLTGDFDSSGVIKGSIEHVDNGNKTLGTMNGLIGQEGAVGVFVGNNDSMYGTPYAGGFVAVPPK